MASALPDPVASALPDPVASAPDPMASGAPGFTAPARRGPKRKQFLVTVESEVGGEIS